MSKSQVRFVVGVDVSKDSVVVCYLGENENVLKQFTRKREKYADLVKDLVKEKPKLVILEATGGYEKNLKVKLAKAGVPFKVVDPLRPRQFAESIGLFAKTDKDDARMLALYALRNNIQPQELSSEKEQLLREYMDRRRQLVSMRADEKKRQPAATLKEISRNIKDSIKFLDAQIKEIEAVIDAEIANDDDLNAKKQILTSVDGVGDQTANTILSSMPELGKMNRQEASALAGLAPFPRDSGQYRGQRKIRSGRAVIRNVLYMATLSAIKSNAYIRNIYDRLVTRGKAKKMAIVACMRKLLVLLNALLKKKEIIAT